MWVEGDFALILSIGQVVPHEVIGWRTTQERPGCTGGPDSINRSHFLGAVNTAWKRSWDGGQSVRRVLNYAASHFIQHLHIVTSNGGGEK